MLLHLAGPLSCRRGGPPKGCVGTRRGPPTGRTTRDDPGPPPYLGHLHLGLALVARGALLCMERLGSVGGMPGNMTANRQPFVWDT